jgi:hypothetical protein
LEQSEVNAFFLECHSHGVETWRRFLTAKPFLHVFGMAVENRRHFLRPQNF